MAEKEKEKEITEKKEGKSDGERRRKTRIYDDLKKTVGDNINSALEDRSYEYVAKRIGISVSSVKAWANKTYLPSLDQLVLLSQILNREPQWFLSAHSFKGSKKAEITYSAAYQILRPLSVAGLINNDAVDDYFLHFLLKRSEELDRRINIPDKKLDEWHRKVMKDFAVPVMHPLEKDMYAMLEVHFGGISEEETAANILNVVRDYYAGKNKDEIDSLYQQWRKAHHPNEPVFYEDDDGDLVEVCETAPSEQPEG